MAGNLSTQHNLPGLLSPSLRVGSSQDAGPAQSLPENNIQFQFSIFPGWKTGTITPCNILTSLRPTGGTNLLLADRLYGGCSARHKNSIVESAYDGSEVVRVDVGHLVTQGVLRSRQSQKATSSPVSLPSESTLPTTIPPPLTKDQQTPEGLPPKYLPTQTSLLLASSFLVRG